MRNRRRVMKLGPCVVYNSDNGIRKAFRNIPGVTMLNVEKLNLLNLAPGGHVGRFCIWTESAISKLDGLYGTWTESATAKVGYNLPQAKMTNTDLSKLFHSQEIQAAIRPKKSGANTTSLKNINEMAKLNPFEVVKKRAALAAETANSRDEKRKIIGEGPSLKSKRAKIVVAEKVVKEKAAKQPKGPKAPKKKKPKVKKEPEPVVKAAPVVEAAPVVMAEPEPVVEAAPAVEAEPEPIVAAEPV